MRRPRAQERNRLDSLTVVQAQIMEEDSATDDQLPSELQQGSDNAWEIEHEDLNDASHCSALWSMSDIFSSISS